MKGFGPPLATGEVHLWWLPRATPASAKRLAVLESYGVTRTSATLAYSVSHSDERTAIAVTADIDIGLDVERVQDFPELEAVASACLGPVITARLRGLDPWRRACVFAVEWTRLEARLKWAGTGFAAVPAQLPPHERSVLLGDRICSIATGMPLRVLRCFGELPGRSLRPAVAASDSPIEIIEVP